jgi:hypothetical protein
MDVCLDKQDDPNWSKQVKMMEHPTKEAKKHSPIWAGLVID